MAWAIRLAAASVAMTLALIGVAHADQIDLGSQSDVEIVATVALASSLKDRCSKSGDMSDETRAAITSWEKSNHVDRVSAEIVRLAKDPSKKEAFATLAQQVEAAAVTVEAQACAALIALFDVPSASFGERTARLPKVGRAEIAEAKPPKQSKRAAPPPRSGNASATTALAEQIEGFGFDTRPGIGYGGMVTLEIYPVVLFKDGRLLADVTGLAFDGGIEAHERENPRNWTRWRKEGSRMQILAGDKWRALAFDAIYRKVPPGFRLVGRYDNMTSTGNIAIGGTDSVTVWDAYEFWPGGEVIKGRTAGADVAGGDYRTVAQATSPDRRGRYSIDGLTLSITYDDGASESVILVTDPQDPDVIWLNGRGFVQADKDSD